MLLDTQILLWSLTEPERLPEGARRLLQGPRSDVFYSVASLWEIAIKFGIGKLNIAPGIAASELNKNGFQRLHIGESHLDRVATLPKHHRDPFDRMLVAQAESEPLRLITVDRRLSAYGPAVLVL